MLQVSVTTVVMDKRDDNGYKALITDTQQLNAAFKQLQQRQQQQQQQQELHFEPFDFANLRRLKLKYKNAQSNGNKGMYKQQQQQQQVQQKQLQHQQQQIRHYGENKASRDQDNDDDSNNINNNDYSYYSYSNGDDSNQQNVNNKNNMMHNKPKSNGNPSREQVDDNDYEQQQQQQDARNSFRLQLSDSNEPFSKSYKSKNNNNNSKTNNNNNNYNDNGDIADTSKSDKETSSSINESQHTDLSFGDVEFNDDQEIKLPYGIQNVKRVPRRNSEHSGKITTYQSLCPTKRVSIPLETSNFEYRPNHYIEVNCAHNYAPTHNLADYNKNRICSEAGFSCIQLNRTIHLIRRNKESPIDCWESELRIVPSGCECMWPKHHYGDIITYHQDQKRQSSAPLNAATSGSELGHVESGDYLEIPIEMEIDAQGQERIKDKVYDIYEFN